MDAQVNLNSVIEIKSSVMVLVNDLEELSEYVIKSKKLAEHAKIHILLDEKQAAKILSLTQEELSQRRFYGKKPVFFKIGKHVRYSLLDLLDYINSCRRRSTSEQAHSQDSEYHA